MTEQQPLPVKRVRCPVCGREGLRPRWTRGSAVHADLVRVPRHKTTYDEWCAGSNDFAKLERER